MIDEAKVIEETNVTEEAKAKMQTIDPSTIRFMTVEQIDSMLEYVVNSNKEVFSMYFTLQKAKQLNKVQTADATSNEVTDDKS